MTHDQRKAAAIAAIRSLHGDTSVDMTTTLESVTEVAELCDELIQTMEEELNL